MSQPYTEEFMENLRANNPDASEVEIAKLAQEAMDRAEAAYENEREEK